MSGNQDENLQKEKRNDVVGVKSGSSGRLTEGWKTIVPRVIKRVRGLCAEKENIEARQVFFESQE